MKQSEKIIAHMIASHPQQDWFSPQDFMPPAMDLGDPFFVGYEASARLSECASKYPDLFESKRAGKYIKRRIKLENIMSQSVIYRDTEFGYFLEEQIHKHHLA